MSWMLMFLGKQEEEEEDYICGYPSGCDVCPLCSMLPAAVLQQSTYSSISLLWHSVVIAIKTIVVLQIEDALIGMKCKETRRETERDRERDCSATRSRSHCCHLIVDAASSWGHRHMAIH
ncbi:GL26720 [Drosophila persimilis]|uniref:GL26720 n=1 Tax=Drosophila persimilis TaxID=7234 RepID=B4HDN4_DROPE|nr:GL26720 [Drosophila persimilis]